MRAVGPGLDAGRKIAAVLDSLPQRAEQSLRRVRVGEQQRLGADDADRERRTRDVQFEAGVVARRKVDCLCLAGVEYEEINSTIYVMQGKGSKTIALAQRIRPAWRPAR